MIPSYPKIFHVGTSNIANLFVGAVEITEKLDGSMLGFAKIDGELHMRSKGAVIHLNAPQAMFTKAVESVQSRTLPDNWVFYGEYLAHNSHNILTYDRVPLGHIALFGAAPIEGRGASGRLVLGDFVNYSDLVECAQDLNLDVVDVIFEGEVSSADALAELLGTESQLGGVDAEGIVVKNYWQQGVYGGGELPFLCGKWVRESFREVHKTKWSSKHTSRGRWDVFCDGFATEARWHKAIQHLRERGELLGEPKDIGALIREVHRDIEDECRDDIAEALLRCFLGDLKRRSTRGLPEFYKAQLAQEAFA